MLEMSDQQSMRPVNSSVEEAKKWWFDRHPLTWIEVLFKLLRWSCGNEEEHKHWHAKMLRCTVPLADAQWPPFSLLAFGKVFGGVLHPTLKSTAAFTLHCNSLFLSLCLSNCCLSLWRSAHFHSALSSTSLRVEQWRKEKNNFHLTVQWRTSLLCRSSSTRSLFRSVMIQCPMKMPIN